MSWAPSSELKGLGLNHLIIPVLREAFLKAKKSPKDKKAADELEEIVSILSIKRDFYGEERQRWGDTIKTYCDQRIKEAVGIENYERAADYRDFSIFFQKTFID